MVKLCIFDMDGLLVDSERYLWTPSMAIAAKEQGKVMTDEFHQSFMGMSNEGVSQKLIEAYGNDFDAKLFFKRTIELNEETMEKGVPLMKGARELLDYLHIAGIKTAIGTTTRRISTMKLLKADGILEEFDGIVCGDEVSHGKPAPDIYLACKDLFKDIDPSEVLIFEDGESGAKAAIASGMRLVLVPDLAHLSDEVRNSAFKVIEDLSKIIDVIKEENERTTSI